MLQRVGYLGLVLLADEAAETLLMVTNSMKHDLACWHDPWVLLNALTALANIASAGVLLEALHTVASCESVSHMLTNVAESTASFARRRSWLC